jgi:membrane protease YdiL (CAAX protease family)
MAVILLIAAPAAVMFCLEFLHSAWLTLLVYQFGICLVIPALDSVAGRGLSWAEHAEMIGLGGPGAGRALRWGAVVAIATATACGGALWLWGDVFLDPQRIRTILSGWGVTPRQTAWLYAIVALVNAPAEELFWRGYLHARWVPAPRPERSPRAASPQPPVVRHAGASIAILAVGYTSYHLLTIARLIPSLTGAITASGGVLAAGLFWGWLRQRTGSVWPALLSHAGAVAAYLVASAAILND